jgi:putrescine aminotransferase
VWLGCNGSDAVEASLKLARLASGRRRVVALEGAYHGKSMGALAVTHNERYRAGLADLLGGGTHVPAEIDALVAELERGDVAAFIFEPIQGEGGIAPVPLEFLRQAVAAARAYGVFVLADEIQVGLGRCGHVSLAGKWGLDPDAVLFGKVLGGGVMPLSAVVCSDDLYAPLKADAFVHTMAFAGHPLSCAAGTAGLELVRELLPRSADVDAAMRGIFVDLAERYPDVVAEARGMGAAWGIECCSTEAAGHVMAELTGHGLIHSPCLGRPQTLRLLPPLIATESDFRVAHEALAAGMAAARSAGTVSRLSRSMSTSVDSAGIWRLRVSA